MAQARFFTSTAPPTTLSAGITNSATTISITSVTGLPSSYPYTMLIEWGSSNQEVVTFTQAPTGSGPYTFANCVRGVDGTTGVLHDAGVVIVHGVSARDFNDPLAHVGASTGVHSVTGAVVGTTDTQTLTNKTLTSPSISTPSGLVKGDVGLGNVDNTSDSTKNSASVTLTNKTIDNTNTASLKGANFELVDGTDTTKKAKFSMSGIATGTTRTYALPDTAGTTLVGHDATQTLSNKTLSSPTFSGSVAGDITATGAFKAPVFGASTTTSVTPFTTDTTSTIALVTLSSVPFKNGYAYRVTYSCRLQVSNRGTSPTDNAHYFRAFVKRTNASGTMIFDPGPTVVLTTNFGHLEGTFYIKDTVADTTQTICLAAQMGATGLGTGSVAGDLECSSNRPAFIQVEMVGAAADYPSAIEIPTA